MKTYEKENQVYVVQEGSELELQLIADGFAEVKKRQGRKAKEDQSTES